MRRRRKLPCGSTSRSCRSWFRIKPRKRLGKNRRKNRIPKLRKGGPVMGRLFAIEIVYRGIFQKTLAKNISRGIVLAAHKEGKPGISFGRYSDSPERNGIPAKNFAIVGTDQETLEKGMAKYEPREV